MKLAYVPKTQRRFSALTGEALDTSTDHWIRDDQGNGIALVIDGARVARELAAGHDALEFAKDMAEFFANNQNGYDDLREKCFAVLAKAYPEKEVASAS